jgi:hypothetical protein
VWPFRAATTSLLVCSRRFRVSFACRQNWYLKVGVASWSIRMSAPAQKNFSPAPVRTMACTVSSKRAFRIASSRARMSG